MDHQDKNLNTKRVSLLQQMQILFTKHGYTLKVSSLLGCCAMSNAKYLLLL